MNQLEWAEEESQAVLRAMATVATDAGESELDGIGRQMLLATRDFILKASGEIPEGELISPSQLAEALPGPEKRRQATEFLVLMPFLPMKVSAARVAQVEAFAEALGVRCDTLRDLRLVCDGRLGRWAVSYGRRTLAAYQPSGAFAQLKLAASALTQFVGNKKVAARYSALQALPEGTLGRTFYDFYRDRSFPLPGEKKSFTELTVSHDLTHILAGYNTDKSGEVNLAGIEAGMSPTDLGFEMLLEVILLFHMGESRIAGGLVEPGRGHFHPEQVMQAVRRGFQLKTDLIGGWDYWQDMEETVESLRRRYGIDWVTGVEMRPPIENNAHVAADENS